MDAGEEEEEDEEEDGEETEDASETDDASGTEEPRDSFNKSAMSRFDVEQPRSAISSNLTPLTNHVAALPAVRAGTNNIILPQKQATNRPISSFTVENILMGNKQSSSTSSGSTASSTHSPTSSHSATSLPSPTNSSSISSSIVGVNWVSHPPVKYTKFTILSPTAMSDEAATKKKKASESSSTTALMTKSCESLEPHPAGSVGDALQDIKSLVSSQQQQQQALQSQHSSVDHKPNATSASPLQVYSLPSLPSSSSSTYKEQQPSPLATTSARLCSLPVVTTLQAASNNLDRKVVLSKTFPPSQQYVLLVPSSSSSAPVSHMVPSVPYDSSSMTPRIPASSSLSAENALTRPSMTTVSFHSPTTATSSPSSKLDISGGRLERGILSANNNTPGSESNSFRLIAPKMKRSSSSGSPSMSSSSGSSRGRSSQGRSSQQRSTSKPPQKLRFHMTTVVTRQKRMPVKSSMTVESPSSVMTELADHSKSSTGRRSHSSDSDVPVESMITRSPNLYSMAASASALKEMEERAQEMQEYPPTTTTAATGGENRPAHSQNGMHQQAVAVGFPNGTNRNESPPHTGSNGGGGGGGRVRSDDSHTLPTKEQNRHSITNTTERNSLPVEQNLKETAPTTRQRRRATRSYTRRKRELTFHLYEEPTAFKAKRACKD